MFKSKFTIMKTITFKAITLIMAFLILTPNALAAKYYLADNNELIKGCSGTIEIKIDTEGSNVIAGDSVIFIDSDEITVNQLSIGSLLPMQVFNEITGDSIKLSGARLPISGAFNGVGTFGYINFTPKETANSGFFNFSQDFNVDNIIVDENIENALTEAVSKTYTFKNRYNAEVDGVGFCTPDTNPPNIQFIAPPARSSNNPVDTNITFTLTDNRAGVDINTLQFSIDGIDYTPGSIQVSADKDGDLYRVQTDPDADFNEGESVLVNVTACDKNLPPNCTTSNTFFTMYMPDSHPAICGDGIVNYNNGEQCDDGNMISGDGCSMLCLFEIPTDSEATCNDGTHNQGEQGIDCGGPCFTPCPTCVDGILNQGEESVDCGGPCRPCGEEAFHEYIEKEVEYEMMRICHYPEDDPENPYTMVVPDITWPDYELLGDTIGACPVFDLCSEVLFLAAPEREEKALEDAEAIIEEGVVEEQKKVAEAPKSQAEVISQIDICRTNPDYADADFDDLSADTDGDGLSDRMECYAETNPVRLDTDGDGCSDFEELNSYYTSPIDGTDCEIEVERFSDVLITDPQPGWILTTDQPVVSGKVPENTALVLVVATQSEQAVINDILKAIDGVLLLSEASASDEMQAALAKLKEKITKANTFLKTYGEDFNSDTVQALFASIPANLSRKNIFDEATKGQLERVQSGLLQLKTKPVVVAASTRLEDTHVGDFAAKNFEEQSNVINDKQLYDLVATAYLNDGSQASSKAVRFSVDKASTINKPIPKTIGGKLIPQTIAFDNTFIGKAFAQSEEGAVEIMIEEERPIITGETEFGSQVFAIWNSVVLASSVISDSEQGAFEVQAPRNLEAGISHRVTLYAVKTDNDNKIRSESVDVYFRIKAPGVGMLPFAIAAGVSVLLFLAVFFIRRTIQARNVIKALKLIKK